MTAHSWSDGTAESIDSLTEKPRRIHCQVLWDSSRPRGCSAIEMAVSGSEQRTAALCMYTREGQMCLLRLTASQANPFTLSLRIVKTIFGSLRSMASTAFAILPSPHFL